MRRLRKEEDIKARVEAQRRQRREEKRREAVWDQIDR